MSEDEEEKEIREWIRNKLEKIDNKQNIPITNVSNAPENYKKSEVLVESEHKREEIGHLVRKENRLTKRLKLLAIVLLLLNSVFLFLYLYFKKFSFEPVILEIYEGKYKISTIKLVGTLISFRISPASGFGVGYIEKDGYVIQVLNLTNLNYSDGDIVEIDAKIERDSIISLTSIHDRKVGRYNKISPRLELRIIDIDKDPKKYEWRLIGVRDAFIENIIIISTLQSNYTKEEHRLLKIKLRGLNMDAFYVGPAINIEVNKSYNLLCAILKVNDSYILRIFNKY